MRGTVSGAVWGLVLGGAGVGIVSLVAEQPVPAIQPQMPQIATPETSEVDLETAPTGLVAASSDPTPAVNVQAPQVTQPAPADEDTIPKAVPLTMPEAYAADPVVSPPVANDETAIVAPPESEEAPVANPTRSEIAEADHFTAGSLMPEVAVIAETPDSINAVTSPQIALVAPEARSQQMVVIAPPATQVPETTVDAPSAASTTVVTDAPARSNRTVEKPLQPVIPDVAADQEPEPSIAEIPPEPPVVENDVSALPRVNSGVRVNRPGATPAPSAESDSNIAEPVDADASALERFAAPFENPQEWPVVGVVLLDDGTLDDADRVLAALPFPVTVILDPLNPNAAAAMISYRSAGVEVGLQVAFPFGARAQDMEVAFEAAFRMLPESVILFSGGDDLMQSERGIADQVIQLLAANGMGLIAVERGLNNLQRVATQAGVPAAFVQRVLDGNDSRAIDRALDQAAFRARQGNGIVLQGHLTPQTLDALSDWAKDASINQVAIAPASAILSGR